MRKLIFVLLFIAGAYYIYNYVYMDILSDINGVKSVGGFFGKTADKFPQRAPERSCKPNISKASFTAIENAVFSVYDSKSAFALAELAYSIGMDEAPAVINRYMAAFSFPEDKGKILTLVSRFKDRESFDMLSKFFTNGTFPRKAVLSNIAAFKNAEAAALIRASLEDQNSAIRSAAQAVYEEVKDEPWFAATAPKGDK